jgi:pilus assembly protein CpaC
LKHASIAPLLLAILVLVTAIATAPFAAAQEGVITPSGSISLSLRQGKVLTVDSPLGGVFVADPEIADVSLQSPTAVYIFGKAIGETTVFLTGEDGSVISGRTVFVNYDIGSVNAAISAVDPGGSVHVRAVGRSLLIEGTTSSPSDVDDIRSIVRNFVADDADIVMQVGLTAPNQVNLRVRIAEMTRSVNSNLGVEWQALFGSAARSIGFSGGSGSGVDDSFSTMGQIVTGNLDVNVIVDALAQEGMLTILAEPNLSAVSGESASFLAGGEFPVPVGSSSDSESQSVTVEFKQYGVSLAFTPTIVDDNRISIKVAPEVSELDFSAGVSLAGTEVPGLTTRRASTTVEVGSGQSFAIAGLLKSNTAQTVSRFPGLGDLPVIGALFRSNSFRQGESELVIIITPYIVEPASSVSSFALPTDGYSPPSEIERLVFGDVQSRSAGAEAPRREPALAGSAGFILE